MPTPNEGLVLRYLLRLGMRRRLVLRRLLRFGMRRCRMRVARLCFVWLTGFSGVRMVSNYRFVGFSD